MIGLCFIGTDTGVGKTFVTAAVARLLRRQGYGISICKPVATGARRIGERWLSDDTLCLAAAAGTVDYERVTPWTFPEPAAPPVAARAAGTILTLTALIDAVRGQSGHDRVLLVEAVGGLLCPFTEQETVADWAAALDMPLILVTRRSLGTLNHTLLTLEVARGRALPVKGVIINETSPPMSLAEDTNVGELQRRIDVPILAVVPHATVPDEVPVALQAVDWWSLAHSLSLQTSD
jgi:dethiobiotin synthetase